MGWWPERCKGCGASLERQCLVVDGQFGLDVISEYHHTRGICDGLCDACFQKRKNGKIPRVVTQTTAKQASQGGQLRAQATPDRRKSRKIGSAGAMVCRILPK